MNRKNCELSFAFVSFPLPNRPYHQVFARELYSYRREMSNIGVLWRLKKTEFNFGLLDRAHKQEIVYHYLSAREVQEYVYQRNIGQQIIIIMN